MMTQLSPLSTEEILDGIRQWIEIESPSDDIAAMTRMANKVQADYEAIGVRVERIAGGADAGDHLLVTDDRHCPPEMKEGPGILVLSHIDTVHPIGTLAGPLSFRVEGDRAYGPGAEDMKGGTYLALVALRQLAREGRKTHLPIRHLLVSDEETGSASSKP
jgi:glutamate carboxypeptidase